MEADRRPHGHAIVEQVIAELKQGPSAHLPSGKFVANQPWLAFAINLARVAARAEGMRLARMQPLLGKIIAIPARLARTGRELIVHHPKLRPWQAQRVAVMGGGMESAKPTASVHDAAPRGLLRKL